MSKRVGTSARTGVIDLLTLALRLEGGAHRLGARLQELDQRLEQGDLDAWPDFLATIEALAAVLPAIAPERRGQLLTTAEMASRFNVSSKTLLRRVRSGQVQPAVRLGARGPAAIRWRGDEINR